MIDRQRIAEGMKSLISDGLGRLNAVTGKHSVSNKLSLVALMTLGLTLLFLAASGGNPVATKINAKKEQTNKDNSHQTTENNGGNIASSIPITILNYVSSVDGKPTKDQQDENGNQNTSNRKPIDWVEIESFRAARENLESQKTITSSTEAIARLTNDSNRIAITSAIVSIVALLLIWKTLTAANRANTIARESLEITNQAYISTDSDSSAEVSVEETKIYTRLKNFGNTPAINCSIASVSGHIDADFTSPSRNIIFDESVKFNSDIRSIAGGAITNRLLAAIVENRKGHSVFAATIFIYDTVFGEARVYTSYCETLKIKSDSHTSLWARDAPKEIQEQVDAAIAVELERRTNHTQLSLRG